MHDVAALGESAGMTLELRYKPETGMAERAALFQGESTIGVADKRFGTLRLGRAMSPLWQQKWRFEPWFDSEFMGSLGSYQSGSYTSDPTAALGYANWARIPGALFYDSAGAGGFTLHLASAVSPPAGAAGRTRGGALNYAGDALAGMVSFERNNRDDKICFVAASWATSPFTVMGSYSAPLAASSRCRNGPISTPTFTGKTRAPRCAALRSVSPTCSEPAWGHISRNGVTSDIRTFRERNVRMSDVTPSKGFALGAASSRLMSPFTLTNR
jgi:hypothetical protein